MRHALATVGEFVYDMIDDEKYDVHTVLLVRNGQHGGFDVRVEATDDDMEDHTWTGVVWAVGGMSDWHKVPEKDSYSLGVQLPRV